MMTTKTATGTDLPFPALIRATPTVKPLTARRAKSLPRQTWSGQPSCRGKEQCRLGLGQAKLPLSRWQAAESEPR